MTTTPGEIDDAAAVLVADATRGDEAAFTRIVRSHHEDMTRVSYVICGDLDLADEAVGAAWSIAWRRLASLRDPQRLRPWLISIAANEARQVLRRSRRRSVIELSVAERHGGACDDPARRTGDLDLINALARLDPDDRALLAMRYVAGFDSSELARATGRSASGTRARLARLLERLRVELRDD
jgi:RNA polymerase sigma-70 factor (ECF subfamily)